MVTRRFNSRSAPRLAGDGGAVILEFAIVLPVLVTLLLALYEGGVWYLNSNRLAAAVQLAGRGDANQGTSRFADNSALMTLRAAMQNVHNIKIDYVIIYNASSQDGTGRALPDPTRCIARARSYATTAIATGDSTPGQECNIYTWDGQVMTAGNGTASPGFTGGSTCDSSAWDQYYCPVNRKNSLSGAASPPDFVGIWISGTYTSATGAVGFSTKTITDYAVFKVEPLPGS